MLPITFIIVNQLASTVVQMILLLYEPIASVIDPIRYIGNTYVIIGSGEVKVKIQDPTIVNTTETSS